MIDQNNTDYKKDVNDLNELFKTIWDKKLFISLFTFLVTTGFSIYLYLNSPIAIYKARVMIEIGQSHNTNGMRSLENSNTLKNILEELYEVSSHLPKGTRDLIIITTLGSDKNKIENKLKSTIKFILARHKNKIQFYDKYIMSKQVGNITINKVAVKNKKVRIMTTFITSFILAMFIVYVMNFIQVFRNDKEI